MGRKVEGSHVELLASLRVVHDTVFGVSNELQDALPIGV
jgi:hypothetical protein